MPFPWPPKESVAEILVPLTPREVQLTKKEFEEHLPNMTLRSGIDVEASSAYGNI